ncbi:hypothetical protein KUG47_12055 [Falsochrobactrum sp. TDYN1]|uniref:Uncharacterized protein n=1 Tax=Falsochrobactrum tianjinense TaxID=2706015 RepID=A0A949PP37_9HYPH|nr:hypothetical protein [Falsochrobactrum sp. TDYN1]MBV2144227.1 hypothetical protein [Falsochrobactrum sp. TDYN1]
MSSTYLNSSNMNMITRLLREARTPGDTYDLPTKAARFLVHRFESGTVDEGRLRIALKRFTVRHNAMYAAVNRWDNEGGATKREA